MQKLQASEENKWDKERKLCLERSQLCCWSYAATFPLAVFMNLRLVSLLWTNHSCSAIHLLTSWVFIFCSSVLLWLCWLVYSLTFNDSFLSPPSPRHFLFVRIRPRPVCFMHLFVTQAGCLVLPLSTGRRPPLTHEHKLFILVFQGGKTDSLISHLIFLFSLSTLLLPCTPSPSISSGPPVSLGHQGCISAFLHGYRARKHPPYIQTFTHLLGLNPKQYQFSACWAGTDSILCQSKL